MKEKNWYTDFLLHNIVEKKKELALFNALADKYPQASEIAYSVSQEVRQLIQDVVTRKRQQHEQG